MKNAIKTKKTPEPLVASFLLIWAISSFLLGYYNAFQNSPAFLFGSCIVAIQALLIILYFTNRGFNQFSNSIRLSTIALLHLWRILAGWVFIANGDKLPQTFVNNAAYGDILAGFLGILVFILGRVKIVYYVFNVVGLLDFIIAVGTGLTLSASSLQSMERLWQLPLIIIPLFGVPISGFTHIVSLNRLFKMKNGKWLEQVE